LSQAIVDGEGVQGRGPPTIDAADERNAEGEENQRQFPQEALVLAPTAGAGAGAAATGRHARAVGGGGWWSGEGWRKGGKEGLLGLSSQLVVLSCFFKVHPLPYPL